MKTQKIQIDISFSTLIKLVLFGLSLYIIFSAFNVFLTVYVSLILASALSPIVHSAKHIKIPKTVTILVLYLAFLSLISWIFSLVIIPIVNQTEELIANAPDLIDKLSHRYGWVSDSFDEIQINTYLQQVSNSISQWSGSVSSEIIGNAWNFIFSLAGGAIVFLLIFVLTFYLLIGEESISDSIVSLFPQNQHSGIKKLITDIRLKLGAWARGQIVLSLVIGVLNYIMLELLNVKYSIAFSVFAGIMEVVPMFGPILTTIVIVLFLLPSSLFLAMLAFIGGFVIQQLENSFIVPYVMNKAVGLNPLYVLLSILIGQELFGVVGALLAVPFVVTIQIIVTHIQSQEKDIETKEVEMPIQKISLAKIFQKVKMKIVK